MPKCTVGQAHSMAKKKIGPGNHTKEWHYKWVLNGRMMINVTMPDPHGSSTELLRPGTLNGIISQLNLSKEEFERWRDCSMDEEEYKALILSRQPGG